MDDVQSATKDFRYKVLVKCLTYNQNQYIKDALNGFAIQQTDFPYVCLVIDDASIDGEPDIIKAFLERDCNTNLSKEFEIDDAYITIAPHKTNSNCTFVVYFLKKNLYGNPRKQNLIDEWRSCCQYEAICEGDDYWISSLKLQKQVDFLDFHSEYSMCCSDAKIILPDGVDSWTRYDHDIRIRPEDMIKGGGLYVQTASLLFRIKLWEDYPPYCRKCHVGDYPLKIWGSVNGGLYWFAEKMVAYRYQSEGSWTKKIEMSDCSSLITKWRSEIEMLKGVNEYSHNRYKTSIEERMKDYVLLQLNKYPDQWKLISDSFKDCIVFFNLKEKVINFLMRHRMRKIIEIWRSLTQK